MVGQVTASQIASVSRALWFGDFSRGFRRMAEPSASRHSHARGNAGPSRGPSHTRPSRYIVGALEMKGRHSRRAMRFRSTTRPVSSMPTT